jgi:Tol biopolymer transport system component
VTLFDIAPGGKGLMRRLRWLLAGLVGVASLGLLPGVASAEGCPNEALRTGLSANLPDCRAYELVSPVDKNDGAVGPTFHVSWQSSVDGNRMAFSSSQAFADSQSGAAESDFYVASRGGGGWSTHALLPPQAVLGGAPTPLVEAFSPDLSSYVLRIGGGAVGQDDPPLVSGEPQNSSNLFVRGTDSGVSQLVDVTPPAVTPPAAATIFQAATPDLSHVVFLDAAQLTANSPAERVNLYEWSGGVVSLVSILPGGEPITGPVTQADFVSEDGSRVVFHGGCSLCLRDGGVRTVQVDASQGPGPGGEGEFEAASSDASRIFFRALASRGLTSDTPTGGSPETNFNLYEYDVASGGLTDLTPSSEANVGADEGGGVVGVSSDGSYVYFVASGALAAGATAGQANLYVRHEGVTRFIATLESSNVGPEQLDDTSDWNRLLGSDNKTAIVTPDGLHLAFTSVRRLTGYDNTDAITGRPDREVFLYDVATGALACASCNPRGTRPVGPSYLGILTGAAYAESNFATERITKPATPPRFLSADGSRLFFESFDALAAGDTNGKGDVYEYANGGVRLISSGTSGSESHVVEASASGSDVFFFTTQQLVGQDVDRQSDLYDARVGGGFPGPVAPVSCGDEGCRGAPSGAPVLGAPGSATFAGAGNLAPAAAAPIVVSKPKPKPKPKKKVKRRRRHAKRSAARGARRGGGRGHSTGKRG